MKSIRELIGRELKWVQPRATKREFELHDGDDIVATLRFRSSFGSFAAVETGDGAWTFKRVGFWRTHVTICAGGSEQPIAVFRNNTWSAGGTLEFPDGRFLRANTNFWMTRYEFKTDSETPMVRFSRIGGALHLSAMVEIEPAAARLNELPWLVGLGWYLAIKMHDDAAAAAAAAG